MNSRFLPGLLVAACLTAAASGAYVAVRQNALAQAGRGELVAAVPAPPTAQPVAETEAAVGAVSPSQAEVGATDPSPPSAPRRPDSPRATDKLERSNEVPTARSIRATGAPKVRTSPQAPAPQRAESVSQAPERPGSDTSGAAATPAIEPPPEPARAPEPPPAPPEPEFEQLVLPASSVVGLQVDTPLSSERTQLEDRVDARVTRNVTAGGRVAIPAGSRVLGSVTLVERGGKLKERARLGVRFHTLVLADGREMPLRTESILREGESPSNESARKIGGAAIGGAILGAIIGGGKGAVVGGAAGAAGGSAAVMASDRNAATLPAGTIVTVRLAAPVTIEVEKR